MLLARDKNGGLWESNVGGLLVSIRVERRGSELRKCSRARSISPLTDNDLTVYRGKELAPIVVVVESFRIFRCRYGILEEEEQGIKETFAAAAAAADSGVEEGSTREREWDRVLGLPIRECDGTVEVMDKL